MADKKSVSVGNFPKIGTASSATPVPVADAQTFVDVVSDDPNIPNTWYGTADNLARNADAWRRANPYFLANSPSFADRLANDSNVLIGQGRMDASGRAIPNLLTPGEEEYFGSGGTRGSYGEATGLPSTPYPARGSGYPGLSSPADSTETKVVWLATHAPAAIAAIMQAGEKPEDVATVHNVFVARAAADQAIKYFMAGETAAAMQILSVLPARQRIIAAAFMDQAWADSSQEAAAAQATRDEENRQSALTPKFDPKSGQVVTPTVDPAGGVIGTGVTAQSPDNDAFKRLIDATLWPVTQSIHAGRVVALTFNRSDDPLATITPAGGPAPDTNGIAMLGALWDATSEDFISQADYDTLVERHGKANVDTMIAYYKATKSDSPTAMPEFWSSIEDDPRAIAMMTSAMRGENVGGDESNGAELFAAVAAFDQGNLGNIVARDFGLTPDTVPFSVTRDVTNVASWFVLDPAMYAGRVFKAVNVARYGLNSVLAKTGGSLSAAILENRGVYRLYEQFGKSVKAMADESNPAVRAALLDEHVGRFTGPEARFFDSSHTEIALKHKLYTAEDWARFYAQADDAQRLALGLGVPVKVPQKISGAKRGMEYLEQFTPEARAKAAAEAGIAEGANTPAVREAAQTFSRQVTAQGGNRTLYVPHMSAAKQWVIEASRFNIINTPKAANVAAKAFESVLGKDWATRPVEEQVTVFVNALNDPATAEALGFALSDFKAMSANGQRTFAARILDRLFPGSKGRYIGWSRVEKDAKGQDQVVRQKGWQRKRAWNLGAGFSETYVRSRDQWRRLTTRLPDMRRGIDVKTAQDADKVYEYAVAAGVGTDASNLIRLMWVEGTVAQRQNMMIGLTRTFLKASGVHAVSPAAEREILDMMTGIRSGELHAPDQVKRLGGKLADINLAAKRKQKSLVNARKAAVDADPATVRLRQLEQQYDDAVGSGTDQATLKLLRDELKVARTEAKAAQKKIAKVPSLANIRKSLIEEARQPGNPLEAGAYNPSVQANGKSSALYMAQTEDRMAVVNFQKLDNYTARTSMLNALLFNNAGGSFVTDMWVLGTLYGPRFQLRNGLEDVGMYALTGGKVGAFVRGRKVSQAIDGAVARESQDYAAKKTALAAAEKDLVTAQKRQANGTASSSEVEAAQSAFDDAEAAFKKAQSQYGKHAKLGIVRTALTGLSEKATYKVGDDGVARVRDGLLSRVAQFLVPTTSKYERRLAAEEGRDAVAELATRAILRQKLIFGSKDPNVKAFYKRLRRADSVDDLSRADQEILRYEQELLRSEYGYQFKDESAEVTMHLSDATLPTTGDMQDLTYLSGELYRRVWLNGGYATEYATSRALNDQQARAMTAHLRFMTERYTLNQVALANLPRYWRALNRPGSADQAAVDATIDYVLNAARSGRDWVLIRERFRLADDLGERDLVVRMLDDMSHTFTTRKGEWNADLYKALKQTDDNGLPYFTLADDVQDPYVHETDFMAGTFDHPESVLVLKGEPALVKESKTFNEKVSAATWQPMGRSLARMTRNPIWYGNYIEARKQLASLESKYADIFGKEYASAMITDTAAERAYNLTMAYVDNPAIRTNLAWQVRNIARYYRAQEDFARRVIRMGKYEPMGYWKAVLAWQASQDVGFVHKDQYGDEYFVYPLSAPAIGVIQNVSNMLGFTNAKYGVAPVAFGGKVQWLSPSMDPGQWLPTLSSPWTAITLQPLLRSMPVAEDFFKSVERAAFGDIAAETNIKTAFGDTVPGAVAAGFYSTMPPLFKKTQALFASVFQGDLPGSLGYRMTVKTLMAQAAAGNVPSAGEWAQNEDVRDEFLADLQFRTIEMAFLSAIFGLFAPASPQYMEDTASIAARSAGYESLKPAFRDMIQASISGGQTWNEAYVNWMQAHPNDGIFAVSMTGDSRGGYIAPTIKNVDYLKQNQDVWDANPKGFVMFMPDGKSTADDDIKALQALRMYNASEYKDIESMANEMVAVRGYVEWKKLNNTIDLAASQIQQRDPVTGETTEQWREHEAAATSAKSKLRARTSGLSYRLYGRARQTTDEYQGDAMQVVVAARELANRGNTAAKDTLPLVDAYMQFSRDYTNMLRNPGLYDDVTASKTEMSQVWKRIVSKWVAQATNVSDEQKDAIITTFTYALNTSWEVEY